MIDLHIHSTFSDGSETPEEIVLQAKNLGLTAIGLTDHDSVNGLSEFVTAGRKHGIYTVPGVELSVAIGTGTGNLNVPDSLFFEMRKIGTGTVKGN